VLNWSISRNHKEIWNSTKIKVTPGTYLTRRGSVQRLLTNGLRGWPDGQLLCRFGPRLHGHESTQEGEGYGDGESQWRLKSLSASHVARPAGCHFVSYCFSQVSGATPWPYKYPPAGES
jgi:hypothetical protein